MKWKGATDSEPFTNSASLTQMQTMKEELKLISKLTECLPNATYHGQPICKHAGTALECSSVHTVALSAMMQPFATHGILCCPPSSPWAYQTIRCTEAFGTGLFPTTRAYARQQGIANYFRRTQNGRGNCCHGLD